MMKAIENIVASLNKIFYLVIEANMPIAHCHILFNIQGCNLLNGPLLKRSESRCLSRSLPISLFVPKFQKYGQ